MGIALPPPPDSPPEVLAVLEQSFHGTAARLPDDQLELMFQVANHLFERRQFEKAGRIYSLLSYCRPEDGRFGESLAHACRKAREYAKAMGLYGRVLENHPERLDLAMHFAECMLQLGQKDAATLVLAHIEIRSRDGGDEALATRAAGMLSLMGATAA
jgi:Flp pilus assembly protein TadD